MKKNNDVDNKPFYDEFSDQRLQKADFKLPRIERGRASAKNIEKVATSSQLPSETLPKIARVERETVSSAAAEFPSSETKQADPHETLSSRGQQKQRRQSPRRQTQFDEPALREQYQPDFDVEAPVQEHISGDEFIRQVEQQLQAISQRPLQGNGVESDLSDFEQKVNQHREMIKKEVFKKKVSLAKKHDTKPTKKRNESLYEKRARQYRQNAENKYLKEKKKEYAARQLKEKMKEERERSPKQQKEQKEKGTPGRSKSKGAIGLTHPKSVKEVPAASRQILQPTKQKNLDANQRLFENIHGILQNPHKSRSQFLSLNKLKSLRGAPQKRISDLEERIREINQKEGANPDATESISLDVSIVKKIKEHNLLDWRRISISPQRIVMYNDSNFNSQLDRIGGFISKNEHSLDIYVKNRQLLMQIELQNKIKEITTVKSMGDPDDTKQIKEEAE